MMDRYSRLLVSVLIVVEPDQNGFHSFAPALKGLHADGATKDEAFQNAIDALPVYLDSLALHDEPLPIGPYLTVEQEVMMPEIPAGAFLQNVTVQWPFQEMSGIS